MAIHAITGLPGQGKTLAGVHLLRRAKGRRRISNLFPRSGEWEFQLWDDIKQAGHAMVLIDEAHMWFGSREWDRRDQSELAAWQQHRKNGLDLYYTVQDINRIDKAVRELTAYMHLVKKFGNMILMTTYFPEDIIGGKKGKPFKRSLLRLTPGDYACYWTEQIVGFPDGKGFDLGRLARRPERAPTYVQRKGRLAGPELRYVVPSTVVVRCKEETRRLPWTGVTTPIVELVELWRALRFETSMALTALEFEFDGPTGLVRWSMGDYLRAEHPIALALNADLARFGLDPMLAKRLDERWRREHIGAGPMMPAFRSEPEQSEPIGRPRRSRKVAVS